MIRRCEIAWRLGLSASCPAGGCRLARELGEPVGEGTAGPCVVERIAGPRPPSIVLWTLEGLRRELEEEPWPPSRVGVLEIERDRPGCAAVLPDDPEEAGDDEYLAMDRELVGRGMGYRG
jgi:hypothetical protein